MPEFGRLTGRSDRQCRNGGQAKPDLIFDFGSVSPTFVARRAGAAADRHFVPVVQRRLDQTAAPALLGRRSASRRAEAIAPTEETDRLIDGRLKDLPPSAQAVYLARRTAETGLTADQRRDHRAGRGINVGREAVAAASPTCRSSRCRRGPDTIIT
jgi:hypothetical protein